MSEKHREHPIISETREWRGHGENVSVDEIYRDESLRLALMDAPLRVAALRDFDAKLESHRENSNLRQIGQAHRFRTHLRTAHERLKMAGR